MIVAHILLPIIFCVMMKTSHISSESLNDYANDEPATFSGNSMPTKLPPKTETTIDLLNRYRRFIANTLSGLSDACQAHDFYQYLKNNMVNDFGEFLFTSTEFGMIKLIFRSRMCEIWQNMWNLNKNTGRNAKKNWNAPKNVIKGGK